jgi:lipoprotein NlpI
LLYKARALRTLGLLSAARDTLTTGLMRKKNRSDELLRTLRYERALVYEELGQSGRARADLEIIYAEAPTFSDVAERLDI